MVECKGTQANQDQSDTLATFLKRHGQLKRAGQCWSPPTGSWRPALQAALLGSLPHSQQDTAQAHMRVDHCSGAVNLSHGNVKLSWT